MEAEGDMLFRCPAFMQTVATMVLLPPRARRGPGRADARGDLQMEPDGDGRGHSSDQAFPERKKIVTSSAFVEWHRGRGALPVPRPVGPATHKKRQVAPRITTFFREIEIAGRRNRRSSATKSIFRVRFWPRLDPRNSGFESGR